MNKLFLALVTSAVAGSGPSAIAADDMKHSMDRMQMMDSNGDGMISKDEFMKYHEKMFDSLKKNQDGMVDIKDMKMHKRMMHKGMMKDHGGMNEQGTMQNEEKPGN